MSSSVVRYQSDPSTEVRFEIDSGDMWTDVSAGLVIGRVKDAVGPCIDGAKEVLDRVRELGPDEVEVKFGVKVSGDMNWVIAKAATEANFEITLTWRPGSQT